jgi:hypothetical protein
MQLNLASQKWRTTRRESCGALGAAASQLGPDAQAAVVELNKQGGLSHGKVTRCLGSLFGIPLSRGGSDLIGRCRRLGRKRYRMPSGPS